MFLIDTGEMTT